MMRRIKTIIKQMRLPFSRKGSGVGFWGLLSLMVLMGGCTSEVQEGQESRQTLELVPFSSSFFEMEPMGTRAYLPTGYVPYGSLYTTAPKNSTIGVWMTPHNTTTLQDFIYKSGSDWKSTVIVEDGNTYYMYGYMPHNTNDDASITSLNGTGGADYANGAIFTLRKYPTVTADDICAIVGIRKGVGSETITNLSSDVKRGNFTYIYSNETINSIFILLKHLYTGIRFSARIAEGYHEVREINITKVELIGLDIPAYGDLSVTLTANTSGVDPSGISFDTSNSPIVDKVSATLFETDPDDPTDKGYRLAEEKPTNFIGCFAFGNICSSFTLKTTYDVYDKKDNLIRKGCVAENKIDIREMFSIEEYQTINPGTIYTINLLVEPTYLYVLSEPDIDNPTIKVSN